MFTVIFEVTPRSDRWDDYLGLAKQLKPKLEAIDGFIDNERFASQRTTGGLLSLSTWRDEKSVIRWRTQAAHHFVQERGRNEVFADYHLRVGEVIADTAPPVALREQRFDQTETGAAKICTISELTIAGSAPPPPPADGVAASLGLDPRTDGLLDHEVFESITNPGKRLLLGSWRDREAAAAWSPGPPVAAAIGEIRHRVVRIIRDYGMQDRREAPQFYPAVAMPPRT